MNSKTISLKYPIDVVMEGSDQKTKLTQVILGRVKAKHLKAIPQSMLADGGENVSPEEMLPLLASITGLASEQIDEIDLEDLLVICSELEDFLGESLSTGEISSGA